MLGEIKLTCTWCKMENIVDYKSSLGDLTSLKKTFVEEKKLKDWDISHVIWYLDCKPKTRCKLISAKVRDAGAL